MSQALPLVAELSGAGLSTEQQLGDLTGRRRAGLVRISFEVDEAEPAARSRGSSAVE